MNLNTALKQLTQFELDSDSEEEQSYSDCEDNVVTQPIQ